MMDTDNRGLSILMTSYIELKVVVFSVMIFNYILFGVRPGGMKFSYLNFVFFL